MKKKTGISRRIVLFMLTFTLAGCANFGPKQLPIYQYDYNNSLNYGLNQELLLNIVRLAYDDTPYFLTVSSISAQMELSTSVGASAILAKENPNYSGSTGTYTGQAGVAYTQRPTITYAPMRGEEFTQQLLRPVSLDDVNNFSSWSIARTLRVMVQDIGNLRNAENAIRPTSDTAPHYYDQFIEFAHLFRTLQENFQVELSAVKNQNQVQIIATFKNMQDPDTRRLFNLLGVSTRYNSLIFVQSDQMGISDNVIKVQTRSFMGMLYYLSKAVDTPLADRQAGLIDLTKNPDGSLFDWSEVTRGMLAVHYSKSFPKNAYVAIYYRNYWFYVADNDQDSKKTFAMLSQLFALLAKDVGQNNHPVLTLPV